MSDSDESGGNSHFGDSGEYCCTCESCDAEIFGDSGNLEESDDFCDSGGFVILAIFVILVTLMIMLNLVVLVNLMIFDESGDSCKSG